jgi:preprotein translocase subunit YajC
MLFPKVILAKSARSHRFIGSFDDMSLSGQTVLLALGAPPSPPGTQPDPRGQLLGTGGMLLLMLVMFYFVLFRPQQKKAKDHAEMLKSVRPGDKIVTSGGVVATVVTVKEKTLSIRSADSKFEVTKAAVSEITERSGEPSES